MAISAEQFQKDMLREFRKMKDQAEEALKQVTDEGFFSTLDENSNSIAVIVKHMAGNMHARWPTFFGRDGEGPVRHRHREFVLEAADSREALLERWRGGWEAVFTAVSSLGPDDFDDTVVIREVPHSVVQALARELIHYAGHIGQIIFMAKHLAGKNWRTLIVPRGKSRGCDSPGKPHPEEG